MESIFEIGNNISSEVNSLGTAEADIFNQHTFIKESALTTPDAISENAILFTPGKISFNSHEEFTFERREQQLLPTKIDIAEVDILPPLQDSNTDPLTGLSTSQANVDISDVLPLSSGIFRSNAEGQINVSFLHDGGSFESEVGVFLLKDMEKYVPGSREFIQEAARRSASNSAEGHIIISDKIEGAWFEEILGEHEDRNWNEGQYNGSRNLSIVPNENFAFMLTPKGKIQTLIDNPILDGDKRPLFSIEEANLDQSNQLVRVTSTENVLAWEDIQAEDKTDDDYNDVVFQVDGLSGFVPNLSGLINPGINDWRNSLTGQKLIQSIIDPLDLAGNTQDDALRAAPSTTGKTYRGWVGALDPVDYYSFSLGMENEFSLSLISESSQAQIQILDINENIVYRSANDGTSSTSINGLLSAGAYRIRVTPTKEVSTEYTLSVAVKPTIEGLTTSGSTATYKPTTDESLPLINVSSFQENDPRLSGIDGSGQTIAVIDSGIDLNHREFKDKIEFNFDFSDSDAFATDISGTDTSIDGHGTHVASIASRVAPGAGIIALKAASSKAEPNEDGNITYDDFAIEQALQWIIANAETFNIASVNMSFGSGNQTIAFEHPSLGDEFTVLSNRGLINVTASGNEFFTVNSAQGVSSISADPNVISVGAVFDSDVGTFTTPNGDRANTTGADRLTPFSQRHESLTNIFAPGAWITGANVGGGERASSGTSQAAPHISGIAALSQQLAQEQLNRYLTPDEFRQLLFDTGTIIFDGDDEDDNVINANLEFRRVDMSSLANAIMDMRPPSLLNIDLRGSRFDVRKEPLSVGETFSVDYSILNTGLDSADTFDVSFYLSENSTISQRDYFLGRRRIGGVDGNSTVERVSNLTLPSASNPIWRSFGNGDAYIGMIVDSEQDIGETREQNNRNLGSLIDYDRVQINDIPVQRSGVLTVNIERVHALDKLDRGRLRRKARRADFYSIIKIDGEPGFNPSFRDKAYRVSPTIGNKNEITPNWQHSRAVNNENSNWIPITIRLMEADRNGPLVIFDNEDEHVDIDPDSNRRDLNLRYNLETGLIDGEVEGRAGELLYSSGGGDSDKAEIWFRLFFG